MNKNKAYTADELLDLFKNVNLISNLNEKERNILEQYKKKLTEIKDKEDVKSFIKSVYPKVLSSKIHELVNGVSYAIGCVELDSRHFTMLYNPSYSPENIEIVEVRYNKFKDEISPDSVRSLTFGEDGTEDETELWVVLAYFFSESKFLEINSVVRIDELRDDLKSVRNNSIMPDNESVAYLRPKRGNKLLYKFNKEFINEILKKAKRNK